MSIRGNTFTGGSAGPHVEIGVGSIASLYNGAFTVGFLVRSTTANLGFFSGWSDSYGGTNIGGYLLAAVNGSSMFGMSDFSSGFGGDGTLVDGGTITDGTYRWFVVGKDAGSAHLKMSIADLATLTWTHGESTGAANHPDRGVSAALAIGFQNYPMGNLGASDFAAGGAFLSNLSNAAREAAFTAAMADLMAAGPDAAWMFPFADFGSPFNDVTGNGADETTRVDVIASTDPSGFDFALTVPPHEGTAAFSLDLAVATAGARAARGAAALGLDLAVAAAGKREPKGAAAFTLGMGVATSGARASRGVAALTLRLALNAVGPSTTGRPSRLTARARSEALRARGASARLVTRGGYADA
jgi:hypothetical protein